MSRYLYSISLSLEYYNPDFVKTWFWFELKMFFFILFFLSFPTSTLFFYLRSYSQGMEGRGGVIEKYISLDATIKASNHLPS